ncbi:DUF1127 domain-containing protein [Roseibium sp.]|uniref:DUF1127 domain-containing protein n=1 Tax=Roseibium sp. TaxID=1936156 RepID=UPI003A96FAC7
MLHAFVTSPMSLFGGLAARVWRVAQTRRQLNRLNDLSDAQLADIGLTRSDVRWVRQVSRTGDATSLLVRLAREHSMEAKLGVSSGEPRPQSDEDAVIAAPLTNSFPSAAAQLAA